MAVRKSNSKNTHDGPKAIVVFWLIFVVVIVSVFLLNMETIKRNFNLFKTRLTNSPGTEEELIDEEIDDIIAFENERIQQEVVIIQPEQRPSDSTAPQSQQQTQQQTTQTPGTAQPSQQATQNAAPSVPSPTPTPAQPSAPNPAPVQTRERTIYFSQINSDGQILQSKVTRRLPVTETPMQDVLNAMLSGPSTDELRSNTLNLIPANTRLLSATVRGSTAYLNFSEDFMFNTFGVEGYVAQLRQIVWTVTEFQNIRDVQILIEGRRIDYLGEGIWIGSPIGR